MKEFASVGEKGGDNMGTMQSMYSMKAGDELYREEMLSVRYTFSRAEVLSMLTMEDELRASHEVQEAYSQVSTVPNQYFAHVAHINKEVQRKVLRAHGVTEEDLENKHKVYLNIRSHASLWFGEAGLPSWVVYMRYDVSAASGSCGVHYVLPSLTVFRLKHPRSKTKEQKVLGWEDTRATNLSEFKKPGRPLVIFGASIS
jgi:hypothetical protein